MIKLTEAMNTYNPALHTLKEMGYDIFVVIDDYEGTEFPRWKAQKENVIVTGFNPLSLLGLVILIDKYGQNWREYNKIDLYDEIFSKSQIL